MDIKTNMLGRETVYFGRQAIFVSRNPILFAICTSTFSKLCKNLHSGMQKSVQ
jgi:hypothetical protein